MGKVFNENLIASLTSKNVVLKLFRDCVIRDNEDGLNQFNVYLHSYWHNLHISSCCVCMDEKVAILQELKDALIEDIHASRSRSWEMVCMAQDCWWPALYEPRTPFSHNRVQTLHRD